MRIRKSIACLTLCLLLLLTSAALAAAQVPAKVLSACESVLRIEISVAADVYFGSGFVVANNRDGTYIATNLHVIEDSPGSISVWLNESDLRNASVAAKSESKDLAILKLSQPAKQLRPLPVSTEVKQGMPVYALGFPGAADSLTENQAVSSSEITITDGIVSAVRQVNLLSYGPKADFLQINAAINPGNSGGPLLDSKGHVVGINTLSIVDSTGISGAVSASELIGLMDSIDLAPEKTFSVLPILLIAAGRIALVAIVLALVFLTRKRRGDAGCTLDAYARKLGRAMTPGEAVSLLMPVLLEVRNANQEGRLLQKLSTETICVKNGRGFIDAKRLSEGLLTVRFAAPEQLVGGMCSAGTDVYALCAILQALTGVGEGQTADAAFAGVLAKGLAKEPEDRYASAQELILALAPYNMQTAPALPKQAAIPAEAPAEPMPAEPGELAVAVIPEKRRTIPKLAVYIAAAVFAVLLAVGGHTGLNYYRAVRYMKELDLDRACDATKNIWFSAIVPENDWKYLYSSIFSEEQEYGKACELLDSLGDYRNSVELAQEVKYRQAAYLANQTDFDGALEIYKQLGDYGDSPALSQETQYRKGLYEYEHENYSAAFKEFVALTLDGYEPAINMRNVASYAWGCALIEEKDYCAAYRKFLMADGYADADEIMLELKDVIYQEGIALYRAYDFRQAESYFRVIAPYSDTDAYFCLLDAWFYHIYSDWLLDLIGFEDTNQMLLWDWTFAKDYLIGDWRGQGKYFKIEVTNNSYLCSDNLPKYNWGVNWDIFKGVFQLENKDSSEHKDAFKITIIDRNCIQILALKDGSTYTLYRQ